MTPLNPLTELAEHVSAPERLSRLCLEVCPFRVGHRVTVSPNNKFAGDWPGEYIITAIRWEYQRGDGHGLNISIASDDEIVARDGDTSDFRVDDLIPVSRARAASESHHG